MKECIRESHFYWTASATFIFGVLLGYGLWGHITKTGDPAIEWAEWTSALGTFSAVVVALYLAQKGSRDKRKSDRKQSAVLIAGIQRELNRLQSQFVSIASSLDQSHQATGTSVSVYRAIIDEVLNQRENLLYPMLDRSSKYFSTLDPRLTLPLIVLIGHLIPMSTRQPISKSELGFADIARTKRLLELLTEENNEASIACHHAKFAIMNEMIDLMTSSK